MQYPLLLAGNPVYPAKLAVCGMCGKPDTLFGTINASLNKRGRLEMGMAISSFPAGALKFFRQHQECMT